MSVRLLAPALLVLVWLAAAPTAALAATFTVTSTADAPDANTADGVCTSTNGQCTLRAAIQQANALPVPPADSPHVVNLPAGTFTLTIPGRDETNGGAGDLNVRVGGGGLQISGQGATRTIVEAGSSVTTGLDRVFRIQAGAVATIQKLTVQHGTAGQIGQGRSGGGILNEGTLVVREVEVRENSSVNGGDIAGGGGIHNAVGATLTVERSTVADNQSTINGGGVSNQGTATLNTSTIARNNGGIAVGGVFSFNAQSTTVNSATIVQNVAPAGQGAGLGQAGGAPFVLRNTILDNPSGGNCSGQVQLSSGGFNLSSDGSCALSQNGDRTNTDPRLSELGLHGGETRTAVPLGFTGNVVERGARGGPCGVPGTDQRGLARPQSLVADPPLCDVGAVEVPVLAVNATNDPTPVAVDTSPCRNGASSGCSLRQAVVDANALLGASITLPGGTLTLTRAGRDEDAGLTGDLDVHAPIFIIGDEVQRTTIQAGTSLANAVDRIFDIHADGDLQLLNVTLQFGHAVGSGSTSGDGGAIRTAQGLDLNTVIVRDSVADNDGGGVAIGGGQTFSIENSEIRDNVAARNGGGLISVVAGTARQVTIGGNLASGVGGGLLFNNQGQTSGNTRLDLSFVTISSNRAVQVGGLAVANRTGTRAELRRMSVVDNVNLAPVGPSASFSGGSVDVQGSLFARGNAVNCGASNATLSGGLNLSDDTSCNFGTNNQLNVNPLVGPLQNNGSFLRTHALLPGSPAIDVIPESAPAHICDPSFFTSDGRGAEFLVPSFPVVFAILADGDDVAGRACDVGAFEVQRISVATTEDRLGVDPADGRCGTGTNNPCSLRGAIRAANVQGHAVVEVPDGDYHLTIRGADNVSAAGDLNVTGSLTLLGTSAAATRIISSNLDRVMEIRSGARVVARRITIMTDSFSTLQALPIAGGGISSAGSLDLADVTLFRNVTSQGGGGLEAVSGSTTTLKRVLFLKNETHGAGGAIRAASGATLTLENVTFSGNRIDLDQSFPPEVGGAAIFSRGATLTLTNVSLVDNTDDGRGIGAGIRMSAGTITLSNTLLRNAHEDCLVTGGTLRSLGHNVSQDNSCAAAFNAVANDGDVMSADVALGPIADNGGQTQTHALLPPVGRPFPGNPAIDAGSLDTPLDGRNGRCAATDQRNLPRPRDGDGNIKPVCDVGAFEIQGGVGGAEVKVSPQPGQPGQPVTVSFSWTVPTPHVWRDLTSLTLKLVRENGRDEHDAANGPAGPAAPTIRQGEPNGHGGPRGDGGPKDDAVFVLRWTEADDRYALLDASGHELAAGTPGSAVVLRGEHVSLPLQSVKTQGSGPTGPAVTLTLPFVFDNAAANKTFTILVSARADDGSEDALSPAGTIQIGGGPRPPGHDPGDTHGGDQDDPRKPGGETRRQT